MSEKWTINQRRAQEWFATPRYDRIPPTQEMLAAKLNIHDRTITRWKQQDGWQAAVNAIARGQVGAKLPEVYGALLRGAEAGSIQHIRTALELTGELSQIGSDGNPVRLVVEYVNDRKNTTDDAA